jgi:hypothetical protein
VLQAIARLAIAAPKRIIAAAVLVMIGTALFGTVSKETNRSPRFMGSVRDLEAVPSRAVGQRLIIAA